MKRRPVFRYHPQFKNRLKQCLWRVSCPIWAKICHRTGY